MLVTVKPVQVAEQTRCYEQELGVSQQSPVCWGKESLSSPGTASALLDRFFGVLAFVLPVLPAGL